MELIKRIVEKLLEDLQNKQKTEGRHIVSLLGELLTKEEMRHIRVISFKEGILKINVNVPVFLYQLNLKRPFIFGRLREALGSGVDLKDVNFRAGEIE
jgi:hypothetical protein